jgi:hypothetical protein
MRDDKNPTMPPPEVLAGVREDSDITPAPDGGWQRIIHRTNSAAFDETARRIARRKARAKAQILF